MPNTVWSELSPLQVGKYAEYFAKMEFASYGFEVYTSEVDDHGIDFVAKSKAGTFWEVQVKSTRQLNYIFMLEKHFNIEQPNLVLVLLIFVDGVLPDCYLIPATEWKCQNELLCHRKYEGKASEPDYGVNLSKKNMPLLQKYRLDKMIRVIKEL